MYRLHVLHLVNNILARYLYYRVYIYVHMWPSPSLCPYIHMALPLPFRAPTYMVLTGLPSSYIHDPSLLLVCPNMHAPSPYLFVRLHVWPSPVPSVCPYLHGPYPPSSCPYIVLHDPPLPFPLIAHTCLPLFFPSLCPTYIAWFTCFSNTILTHDHHSNTF